MRVDGKWQRLFVRGGCLLLGLLAARLFAPWVCGRDASGWLDGDAGLQNGLAQELIAFEASDDAERAAASHAAPSDRFAGEWALVTHQMTALGLAQLCLAHPELRARYAPIATRAALKSLLPEMRQFGTNAWHGEDALSSLTSSHGHAYLAYAALAVSMARLVDPAFPAKQAATHDALIAAYQRRLLASESGLIETYPREAYPTDVAAVAAAIAVHGRATGVDHSRVLEHWLKRVQTRQIDAKSGFVFQRMSAASGEPHDAPRGSGTGLAAYYAGFVDRGLAEQLAAALFRHEQSFWGFGAIAEYAAGHVGGGDIDSGPVLFGVSVAATGFALAPARALGHRDSFEHLYRTTALFGLPASFGSGFWFSSGGPIGNALLFAFLTSGPELAA
ncbi:MAG TPA: hypothetical protein VFK05_09175 [Polyangiaceae bacterium]|nr:hypothetical protein [Polyangiaceae bacterium]